jgi:COMPASS component SWD1
VASFDRRGEYIFTGNTKGRVMVLTCPDLKMKASFKVTQGTSSATAVKSIEFARRGE